MSNLRASATIMVLRVPRVSAVRLAYHSAKALCGWNFKNRHSDPGDRPPGLYRLVPPAMLQCQQPVMVGLQLL